MLSVIRLDSFQQAKIGVDQGVMRYTDEIPSGQSQTQQGRNGRSSNIMKSLAEGTECFISRRTFHQVSLDSLRLAFRGLEHPAVGPSSFYQTDVRRIPQQGLLRLRLSRPSFSNLSDTP